MDSIILLTEERLYLKEIIQASNEGDGSWPSQREMLVRTFRKLPSNFNPNNIHQRILERGFKPTLLAISLIDSNSSLLKLFDKFMKESKEYINNHPAVDLISSTDFSFIANLDIKTKRQLWSVLTSEVGGGGSFGADHFVIVISDKDATKKILEYNNLKEYLKNKEKEVLEEHSISEKSNNNLELEIVKNLHENITKSLELCQQGLLRQDEFRKIKDNIRTQLSEILDPNSIEGRKFEKLTKKTEWTEHSPESGNFVLKSSCSYLVNWKELLSEILNSFSKNSLKSESIEEEKFVESGKPYSAKKMIHSILETATKEIAIQDNFLDESIFGLLENTSTDLVIKLMGKKVKGAFLQFLKAFSDERKQNVSYKTNKNCHDRFIIIDQTTVYYLGPSIKDAGKKAGMISEVKSEKEKQNIILSFKEWWSEGSQD